MIGMSRIFVNEEDYTELTKAQAERYFENDTDNLELIEAGTHTAYLFLKTEWVGKGIQYAVAPEGFNPSNIDEWGWDEWCFVEDIITVEGD
jgi:hypothetical protein